MITTDQKYQFRELALRLEPENLHEDGEISPSQAQRKFFRLKTQWRILERAVGRPVSEDEVWDWNLERRS
jgi:hypothetical protein